MCIIMIILNMCYYDYMNIMIMEVDIMIWKGHNISIYKIYVMECKN